MTSNTASKQGRSIPGRIAPYLALALMLAASVWLWRFWANAEKTRAQSHFDEYCKGISQDIAERLNTYKMILHGGAGVFLASEEVTRDEWRAYYEYHQVRTLHPGIQGISFVKVIAPSELARHVESIRAEGFPEYSVRPDGERAFYMPVVFIEPSNAHNRQALGYDAFSEPVRRAALERARDTATAAMSGRVRLVHETDEDLQAGFVIIAPIYARGMPLTGVEERRAALTGYVGAVFYVKDFMRSVFAEPAQKVAFELYDGATVSPETLLFASSELGGGPGNGHRARFSGLTSLVLYGHTWTLAFRSTPQFDAGKTPYLSWIILAAGLAISILVFLLMQSQQRIVAKAGALAAKLTVDLRKSEQRFEQSARHGRTFVWETDAEGFYTYASAAVEDLLGYRPEELVGRKTMYDLHPEEGREAFRTVAAEIIGGKKSFSNLENPVQTKSGAVIWVRSNGIPLLDSEGHLIAHRGSDTDITERKQAEDAVRQAKEDWEKTFDAVPDGIMILDLEYRVKQINRAYAALLGRPQADCLGRRCYELLHGTAAPPSYCPHARLLEDGQAHTEEIREERLGKDLALGVFPLRNSEGRLVGSVHIISDITERKQVATALNASEERYRGLVELSPDLIGIHCDGKWVFMNETGTRMLGGTNPAEFIGKPILDIVHPDFRDTVKQRVHKIASEGEATPMLEQKLIRVDGTEIAVEGAGVPIVYQGKPAVEIFIRNISERKQAESDRIAREAAEQANRAKSVFLASMSHEIRTPLNAVLGFAQILERDASLTPRQTGMLHTIARSGRHLLELINDVLDMSKIEAGRLELSPADFCLHDLLDDLEMMFRSRAQAKHLQLLMEREDGVPRFLNADEGKLRQVLINLMGNAVKFTKTGGVAVRIRGETATGNSVGDTNAARLVVEVEDSGPGIAEDELDRIFEPFRQSSAGREVGGTGLGLTVSRRLVELMGGRLTVKSQVGKGSCFRFDALVKLAEGAVQEQAPTTMRQVVGLEPGTGPFRILVADDQKDNRDMLTALLEPLGFEIREAVNGQEALDIFDAWSPHAVLMDMRMPVLDGYETTRRIKATEEGRATPVIAVTATAFDDAESKVLATGVDGYVRKPFRPEEIFAVLGKCLGLRYVYAEDTGQAPDKANVQPLTREDLAAQSASLRQALRQAVDEGDMAGLQALIAQVEDTDAAAARKLRNLADQYDYDTLTQLL